MGGFTFNDLAGIALGTFFGEPDRKKSSPQTIQEVREPVDNSEQPGDESIPQENSNVAILNNEEEEEKMKGNFTSSDKKNWWEIGANDGGVDEDLDPSAQTLNPYQEVLENSLRNNESQIQWVANTPEQVAENGAIPGSDYTVKKGDTLWAISEATGVPVAVLAHYNNIANAGSIQAGQKIVIPKPLEASPNDTSNMQLGTIPLIGNGMTIFVNNGKGLLLPMTSMNVNQAAAFSQEYKNAMIGENPYRSLIKETFIGAPSGKYKDPSEVDIFEYRNPFGEKNILSCGFDDRTLLRRSADWSSELSLNFGIASVGSYFSSPLTGPFGVTSGAILDTIGTGFSSLSAALYFTDYSLTKDASSFDLGVNSAISAGISFAIANKEILPIDKVGRFVNPNAKLYKDRFANSGPQIHNGLYNASWATGS